MLATNPLPTGSETDTNTMGIVRVASISAVTTGVLATRVALLSPGREAEVAFAPGTCASGLAALTPKSMTLGDYDGPNRQFIAGDITGARPDFCQLERLVAEFLGLISPGPAQEGTRATA